MPAQRVGVEARKPVELSLPVVWMSARDGDVGLQGRGGKISACLPRGAAGAFEKSKFGVKVNCAGVILADVKPDVVHFFFMGMLHCTFGERACNPLAAIVRMCGDICDEINALLFVSKRDDTGVADNLAVFLPDVSAQRQGRGFGGAVCPPDKRIVVACAAHILHVSSAVAIHGAGEAGFDQVGYGRQVS